MLSKNYRLLSTLFKSNVFSKRLISNEVLLQPKEEKKKSKPISHKVEIDAFFKENPDYHELKHLLPPKLLRRTLTTPETLHLIDKTVAKSIAFYVKEDVKLKNSIILEINPGFGFLTDEIIKTDIKQIELLESKSMFYESLQEKYGDNKKVLIQNVDFLSISTIMYHDRFDNGNRFGELMKNITPKPWNYDTVFKIIGAVPNKSFILQLINSITCQMGIVSYGRPELIIAVPPSLYYSLTATPESGYMTYRASSVLFHLLFQCNFIQKLPRSVFLPWQTPHSRIKKRRSTSLGGIDENYLYLIHVIGRKNLPVPNEQLRMLQYFIQHHLLTRTSRVIPQLEAWIPGSGKKYIAASIRSKEKRTHFKNLGIFTQFGELHPLQILDLFKQFVEQPEFPECPFTASMEASSLKMETSEEEAVESQKQDTILTESEENDPLTS